ncbi:MAG: DUF3999 domain-containing protein [Desulfopila sp.]
MRTMAWPLLAWWLLTGWPAMAQEVSRQDFAFGYIIETGRSGAIYSLPIPDAVYRTVQRADLADIRVFNDDGEVVPHLVRDLAEASQKGSVGRDIAFFPLPSTGELTGGNLSLSVRRHEDGTIIDIDSGGTTDLARDTVAGYLLDLGPEPTDIGSLELQWFVDVSHGLNSVMLEQSTDLQHWRTIVAKATLADLVYGDNRVEQRTIALPSAPGRYLRLSWLQPQSPAVLRQVLGRARLAPSGGKLQWIDLDRGQRRQVAGQTVIDYSLSYHLPVRQLRLAFAQPNSIVKAAVQSRAGEKDDWRQRCSQVFYSLQLAGESLQNAVCTLQVVDDLQWRLVVLDDGSGLSGGAGPLLQLGWQQGELLFLARGSGPFLLAYGSGKSEKLKAEPVNSALSTMMAQQAWEVLPEAATLGRQVELGGDKALSVPPPPKPWKSWLLWAAMAAAVAAMAVMAVKLLREMRHQ